jgi:hypothetical protein
MHKLHLPLILAAGLLLLGFARFAVSAPPTTNANAPDHDQYDVTGTNGSHVETVIEGQPIRVKKVPPPPPPQKTKYDKLPLAALMAKANNGDLTAQFELGSRFNYGRSVPKDTAQALHWLRKAAKAGDVNAARLLANKFYNGFDVEVDYAEAIKWAEKLAETHDVSAALMLGNMYANGEGSTKRDLPRSYTWFAIGAGNEPVDENDPEITDDDINNNALIETAKTERDNMAGLISAREEKIAQRNASDWWMKHPVPVRKKDKDMMNSMNDGQRMAPAPAIKSSSTSR